MLSLLSKTTGPVELPLRIRIINSTNPGKVAFTDQPSKPSNFNLISWYNITRYYGS